MTMSNETRRYRHPDPEDAPLELDDVLEPFDPEDGGTRRYPGGGYPSFEPGVPYPDQAPAAPDALPPDDFPADPYADPQPYQEEYSDYHQELDQEERSRSLFSVFNVISTLAGVVVILLLTAMLFSLASWLRTDILHSITLLQSGLQ